MLITGAYQISSTQPEAAVAAIERGAGKLAAISAPMNRADWVLAGAAGIKSLKDLKGKIIGVSSLRISEVWLTTQLLERAGLKKDDFSFIGVGTSPLKVTALVDRTPELKSPLLGLFGNDDHFPDREQVDELEAALTAAGKEYEFHRYDDAGHAFFSVDRTAYRPEAAVDGWQRIFEFYAKFLGA